MALDERLRRELDGAGHPADPSGVYEHLIRRKERRLIVRKLQVVGLAVLVVAGSIGGVFGLSRVFPGSHSSSIASSDRAVVLADRVDGRWDLYAISPDGSPIRRLTNDPAEDLGPDWSPDGRRIVFSRFEPGRDGDLYVIDADGSNLVQLTDTPAVSETRPRWSPDGARIVFEATRDDGPLVVEVMNADGTELTQLTDDRFASGAADWSPDGTQLVYNRSASPGGSGAGEIWIMDADGTDAHAVTHGQGAPDVLDYEPRWSPDGSRIVFTRVRDVYAVDPDGTDLTNLTPEDGTDVDDRGATWSPDGSTILFASDRDGGPFRLFTMNPDGSNVRPFSDRGFAACCPEPDWGGDLTSAPTDDIEPTPTGSPTPSVVGAQDLALGFPVCNVTSVRGVFAPGVTGSAFVATKVDDAGGCPDGGSAFHVVAVDVDGDGRADASYGPVECDPVCSAFAAPDVDGDGTDELLVENIQFRIAGVRLYDVSSDPPGVMPVTVATPGYPEAGLPPGAEPQLFLGGDGVRLDTLRCLDDASGRVLISTSASQVPPNGPDAVWQASATSFVLDEDGTVSIVDTRTFGEPVGPGPPSFADPGQGVCGARIANGSVREG